MNKIASVIAFVFLALSFVFAQTPASMPNAPSPKNEAPGTASHAGANMPSQADVEAAMKRTLGYDPSLSWTIYDIRPSSIPGVADVVFSINKQAAQHIYMSTDTQNAIIGEMIPFGPNPFVPVRARLQAADGPAAGPPAPSISIVEFSDLECPHCKAAQPIVEKLAADFPQARFIFQQFPLPASLHPWALKAAEYADCVGRVNPATFWKYIDTVFENQGSIALATADDQLKGFATAVGVDPQKISTCAGLPQTEARVKKSLELGQSLDVNETPTVFINGRRVLRLATLTYDQLKVLVQFEIDHAGK